MIRIAEPFKLFRRTSSYQQRLQLVSAEARRLARSVEQHDRFQGTGTIHQRRYGGSIIAVDGRPWVGWATITGAPTGSAYPWQEQYTVGATIGNQTEGRSGTAAANPAREVNGNTGVPVGAKVIVWIDDDHEGYRFSWQPSGGGGLTTPSQITSNQNNYSPSATLNHWAVTSNAAYTITGLGDPAPGRTVTISNNGTFPIYFDHQSASSTSTNRIITPTETTLVLPPCHSVTMTYGKDSSTKWGITNTTFPLYCPIAPPQITTTKNDYDLDTAITVRLTSDAERTITGIAGPWPDRHIILRNVGTENIVFTHEDAGSTAINRFSLPNDQSITLRPDESLTMIYDATTQRWRPDATTATMLNHLTAKFVPQFLNGQLEDSTISQQASRVEVDDPLTVHGYLMVTETSEPADGVLNASEVLLWFDDSNGASKLMIKAKSADGTVVTGQVALS